VGECSFWETFQRIWFLMLVRGGPLAFSTLVHLYRFPSDNTKART
jgi:hypothetical protein